jgi:hypothetical protein
MILSVPGMQSTETEQRDKQRMDHIVMNLIKREIEKQKLKHMALFWFISSHGKPNSFEK